MLWNAEDRKNILAATGSARARAEGILRFAESGKCRRDVLLDTLGVSQHDEGNFVRLNRDACEAIYRLACKKQ